MTHRRASFPTTEGAGNKELSFIVGLFCEQSLYKSADPPSATVSGCAGRATHGVTDAHCAMVTALVLTAVIQ